MSTEGVGEEGGSLFVLTCPPLCRACDRSRLRIAAACGLVKLAKSSAIREFISVPIFQTLALVVQVLLLSALCVGSAIGESQR